MSDQDPYLHVVDKMEPDLVPIDAAYFHASAAISLKRIADSLERIEKILAPPVYVASCPLAQDGPIAPGYIQRMADR